MAKREFMLPLAELIDRMTITQIKTVLAQGGKDDFLRELERLRNDIDGIIMEKGINITAELLQSVVILSQLNLHIWKNKDEMQKVMDRESEYMQLLKHAHQLNGYRNNIKNSLLKLEGHVDQSQVRSNFEVDGLKLDLI